MLQNVILDIGDVLVHSNYRRFFREKGYDDAMIEQLAAATFLSPAWSELDRGVWSFDRLMEAFVQNDPEIEDALRGVFDDTSGFVIAFPYAQDWIRRMQSEGLRVYCLSNISDLIYHGCEREFDFLKLVDGQVLSYQEKLVKPDPAIYRLLLDRYGLDPGASVFVDNTEENVNVAKRLGLRGIVFLSQPQAAEEIERMRREAP